MSYILPSMGLLGIRIGLDTGLTIETNTNSNWAAVDGHDHTSGKGVQVPTSGLNINADLPFNGNNATLLRSSRYSPQTAALSLPTDLGCVYVAGVDLYYNDVNGTQIQLTAGGSVNATSSGISDGTATASFTGSGPYVLVVDTDVATPADIQVGSVLLGNNVANSNFLKLSPPAAMPADFTLTLPSLPGATSFVTLDTSGNFGASIPTSGGIGTTNLAAGAVTSAKIAAGTIVQSNMGILNPTAASPVSNGTTNSTTPVVVSGLARTITTSGGAVLVTFSGFNVNYSTGGVAADSDFGIFGIYMDGVLQQTAAMSTTANIINIPASSFNTLIGPVSAGSHTFSVRISVINGSGGSIGINVSNVTMRATEI